MELNLFMNNSERNQSQIIVGKQIQFLRKKSNLTQANLAYLSNMDESALQ